MCGKIMRVARDYAANLCELAGSNIVVWLRAVWSRAIILLMFYLSYDECVEFCVGRNWNVDTKRRYPVVPDSGFDAISFMVPPQRERLTNFCRLLSDIIPIGITGDCLLWVIHWDDWGSQANYHLYYRLRQSYSDFRQIYQAPGHVFLAHETHDIISFTELAFLFGWDFHLLSGSGDWGAYHDDELLIIYSNEPSMLEIAKSALANIGIEWRKHN